MNQLRYLKKCILLKGTKVKQANGNMIMSYELVREYDVQIQKVTDSISASIYGADINRVYRFLTPLKELETYLFTRFDYGTDNVTNYYLELESKRYKVVAINDNWVDAKLQ